MTPDPCPIRPKLGETLDLTISGASVGPYDVTPEATHYWQAIEAGRIEVPRCRDCGRCTHPRHAACSNCFSGNLEWTVVSGEGEVYTYSTIFRPPPGGPPPGYTLGMVLLDDGVCLFAEIRPTEAVRIGARVKPFFEPSERGTLLMFEVDAADA